VLGVVKRYRHVKGAFQHLVAAKVEYADLGQVFVVLCKNYSTS